MKLNWGHYITISFVAFVLLILYMVFRSYQHTNDLVAEDYYAKEIKFQDVIDKKTRAAALPIDITWESKEGGILITYPEMESDISGEILLFRPSDKSKDVIFEVSLNEMGEQYIKEGSFIHGKYLIQIDWKSGGIEYFTEGTAYVIQ